MKIAAGIAGILLGIFSLTYVGIFGSMVGTAAGWLGAIPFEGNTLGGWASMVKALSWLAPLLTIVGGIVAFSNPLIGGMILGVSAFLHWYLLGFGQVGKLFVLPIGTTALLALFAKSPARSTTDLAPDNLASAQIEHEPTSSGENIGRAGTISSNAAVEPTLDRAKWEALLKYDNDIAAVANRLHPLGARWLDEFASSYLALNDKTYLQPIEQKIVAAAALESEKREQERIAREKAAEQERIQQEERRRARMQEQARIAEARRAKIALWQNRVWGTRTRRVWTVTAGIAVLSLTVGNGYWYYLKQQEERAIAAETQRAAEEARRQEVARQQQSDRAARAEAAAAAARAQQQAARAAQPRAMPADMPSNFLPDFEKYLALGDAKAMVMAREPSGRATWSWSYNAPTSDEAVNKALSSCESSRQTQGITATCRLFAIGQDIRWGSTSTTAQPSPPIATATVGSQLLQPRIRVGDRHTYQTTDMVDARLSNVVTREVVSISSDEVTMKFVNEKSSYARLLTYNRDLGLLRSRYGQGDGVDYSPAIKYIQVPGRIGDNWVSKSTETNIKTGKTRVHVIRARIDGRETVTVPAGSFEAFRIVIESEVHDDGKTSTGQDTSWFSPHVGRSVKSELRSRDPTGKEGHRVVQLMSYSLSQ